MLASNRTYGVEIECYIPNNYFIQVGSYHNGASIPGFPAGWNAQSDSSLVAPMGYYAVEIVSPILSGEDGVVQIVNVVDFLSSIGAVVNSNCGLHVHVGASDYTQMDVSKLVTLFKRYEKMFFALNGAKNPERWNNTYCKRSNYWTNIYTDRYQSLNLTNLFGSKKTVEFRLFSGTMEAEKVIQAVFMAVALVNKSKEIERVKTPLTLPQTMAEMLTKFQRVIMSGQLVCDLGDDDSLDIVKSQAPLATF